MPTQGWGLCSPSSGSVGWVVLYCIWHIDSFNSLFFSVAGLVEVSQLFFDYLLTPCAALCMTFWFQRKKTWELRVAGEKKNSQLRVQCARCGESS